MTEENIYYIRITWANIKIRNIKTYKNKCELFLEIIHVYKMKETDTVHQKCTKIRRKIVISDLFYN